ncbi:hypothetical protein [Winogradskyella sp. PC D3.3]
MNKIIDIDFCTLKFYDNYMLTIMKEGVHVDDVQNEMLIQIAEEFYKDKPFVYITYRINSYSVNPNIYATTSKMKSLAGFAVVCYDYKAKKNAQIEKLFLNKPFEIFCNLNEAFAWADKLINKE